MKTILETSPQKQLEEFLLNYNKIQPIDLDKAKKDIMLLIKYYRGTPEVRDELVDLIRLENQWYSALENDQIDYSVYNDKYYFADTWACWSVYSRIYLKNIQKNEYLKHILTTNCKSILDLGCGIAYSTAALKELFPKMDVNCTDLENTKRYKFCKEMSKKYDFNLYPSLTKISKPIDLIFASEYFEHIEAPGDELDEIVNKFNPKYLILANAFNTRSVGHFIKYKQGGVTCLDQKEATKHFNYRLREMYGYKKLYLGFWNDRPNVWERNDIFYQR